MFYRTKIATLFSDRPYAHRTYEVYECLYQNITRTDRVVTTPTAVFGLFHSAAVGAVTLRQYECYCNIINVTCLIIS